MLAFFSVSHFTRHRLLLDSYLPTDLASRSEPLSPYEIFTTNYYTLAGFRRPDYLTAQVLEHFHNRPSKTFAF